MQLHNQLCGKNNVFNMTSEAEDEHIMMLQFSKDMEIAEQSIDIDGIDWLFLTEMLG